MAAAADARAGRARTKAIANAATSEDANAGDEGEVARPVPKAPVRLELRNESPTPRHGRSRIRGFTLIELLVAMAIVAVIGVMALGGLSEVINQQTIAREHAERWQDIQLAMRMIAQDLAQMHPRPTREELGESFRPSLLAQPGAQFALEFSRGGWANPASFPRGTVLRVAYDWEDDKLVRFNWSVMDRTLATPPLRTELLDGVTEIEIRFMDSSGAVALEWPPLQSRWSATIRSSSTRGRVRRRARGLRTRLASRGDERLMITGSNMRARQRGVAILTAMLVVTIGTIIAVNLMWQATLDLRRTEAALAADQGLMYVQGAEAWAADILRQDQVDSPDSDHLGEQWATELPPLPVDGGVITGPARGSAGTIQSQQLGR